MPTIEEYRDAGKTFTRVTREVKKEVIKKNEQKLWKHRERIKVFHGELGNFIQEARRFHPDDSRGDGGASFQIVNSTGLRGMDDSLKKYLTFRDDRAFYGVHLYKNKGNHVLEISVHSGYAGQRFVKVESRVRLLTPPTLLLEFNPYAGSPDPPEVIRLRGTLAKRLLDREKGPELELDVANQLLTFALREGTREFRQDTPRRGGGPSVSV